MPKPTFIPSPIRIFLLLLCFTLIPPANAEEPVSASWGVAIGKHDTAAYHESESIAEHKARKGSKEFSVEWKGETWLFRNAENRDAFLDNPEKYAPAYNGHCANALSLGEGLVETNGETWEIYDDQLYLFYATRGLERWNDGNWQTYKQAADKAWKAILADQ